MCLIALCNFMIGQLLKTMAESDQAIYSKEQYIQAAIINTVILCSVEGLNHIKESLWLTKVMQIPTNLQTMMAMKT